MKLKDFVVNSLPRSKSKKKKASKKQTLSNSKCQNENKNIPSPCSSEPGSPDVTLNKSLVTDDFHYLSKIEREQTLSSTLPRGTYINVNFNVNEVNKKCTCYKQISPCVSPASPYDRPLSDITPPGDSNFNTIPRVRTRIKTNPWLPSPRTSTTDSPMSSEASSPTYAAPQRLNFDNSFDRSFSSDNNNYGRYDPSAMCTLTRNRDRKSKRHRSDSDSVYSSDNDSLLYRSVMSDTDNSLHTPEKHRPAYTFNDGHCSSTPRKPRRNRAVVNSESEQTISDVSFEYEEAFESRMEPDTTTAVGSRDNLDDFYGLEDSPTHTPTSTLQHDTPAFNSTLKFRQNLNKYYDDSCETDDTLCENSLRRKIHSKSSQGSIDQPKSTSESEMDQEKDTTASSDNRKETSNQMQESFDSAFESAPGTFSMTNSFVSNLTTTSDPDTHDRKRLDEIRSSLSQKVRKLREEKLVVDAKIRQAQEEERIRVQEMMRFQKQLTQYRKQLLLQTLRDLKNQLDDQSKRLQTAYSTVLNVQMQDIHSRYSRPLAIDNAAGLSH
jgi:hypothetical protein